MSVSTQPRPSGSQFRPEPAPRVATPTLVLFGVTFAVWCAGLWATLSGHLATPLVIALNAAVTFAMFTIVHEATHHAVGASTRLNNVFGRLSMLWFAGYAGFGLFRWIHIEHHRNTNEDIGNDPDAWAKAGPTVLLPLRWVTLDLRYLYLWARARRPFAERLESIVALSALAGVIVATCLTGTFWWFLIVFLIPQRIGLIVLVWWFDWLPHHGLEKTQREDRYKATRIRAGWEPVLTPVLLYQNYHLVHHLHPSVPFYRYIKTWRAGMTDFLAHEPPLTKVFGGDLSVEEYCEWQGIVDRLDGLGSTARSHPMTVTDVTPLTDDSVAVTVTVPPDLADRYRFQAGQHITVTAPDAGITARKTYSLCLAPTADGSAPEELRIGVKRLDGGEFSTYAHADLAVGDMLEIGEPSGRFAPELAPDDAGTYVLIAAGSGITPILSVLAAVLATQPSSRCVLFYGNRSNEATMFRDELAALADRHSDRLNIHHYRSGDDRSAPADGGTVHNGRISPTAVREALDTSSLDATDVDHWLVCGPSELTTAMFDDLSSTGVAAERIHRELFHVDRNSSAAVSRPDVNATVIVTHDGGQATYYLPSNGESVLDAGLREMPDLPYSCIAGACGTCRAKVCSGTVEMDTDAALSPAEKEQGFILTCQSHPTSEEVVIDYDATPTAPRTAIQR